MGIYHCFLTPSSRLQLLTFLNLYVSDKSFPPSAAAVLARHPLMSSLSRSLLLDNSSTVCTIGLTLLVNLFPIFAVEACPEFKSMLPNFLAILARILCWKERPPSIRGSPTQDNDVAADTDSEAEKEMAANRTFEIRSDIHWKRLETAFRATTSTAPSVRQYFTILYYLFPCNVLRFLRDPVSHLVQNGVESPFALGWPDVLDEDKIRSKSEVIWTCRAWNSKLLTGPRMFSDTSSSSQLSSLDCMARPRGRIRSTGLLDTI
jgi:hypothetical protein